MEFYGYFGGINTVGDLTSYGQYSDDSTFELIPAWQNKSQANGLRERDLYKELSLFLRAKKGGKLRIFPQPAKGTTMWVDFSIPTDTWEEHPSGGIAGVEGINNMNTLPFENIPFKNINSIGKHWIRRFALALCKEMLEYDKK